MFQTAFSPSSFNPPCTSPRPTHLQSRLFFPSRTIPIPTSPTHTLILWSLSIFLSVCNQPPLSSLRPGFVSCARTLRSRLSSLLWGCSWSARAEKNAPVAITSSWRSQRWTEREWVAWGDFGARLCLQHMLRGPNSISFASLHLNLRFETGRNIVTCSCKRPRPNMRTLPKWLF